MHKNTVTLRALIHLLLFLSATIASPWRASSQTDTTDRAIHPYHLNYWVTGGILVAGVGAEKLGINLVNLKSTITHEELQSLDRGDITAIDRWALHQDPSNMSYYVQMSDNLSVAFAAIPLIILLDGRIRPDWLDVMLMYAETAVITQNIYTYSPIGATFINRYRPVVYYDTFGETDVRTRGGNRSSMYSGHVAQAASASFFTAKIFCDYHPELGWKKYLVYGAALAPPVILGYFRLRALAHFPSDMAVGLGVGAACGILIPELHHVCIDNASLGVYSSMEGTGLRLQWTPKFGK